MTDRESRITHALDQHTPPIDEEGSWARVVADSARVRRWSAGTGWRKGLLAAFAALAGAALVGVLPALAGDGYYWTASSTRTCEQVLVDTLGRAYTGFRRSLLPPGYRPTAPVPLLVPGLFHSPAHLGTELGVEKQSAGVWDAGSAANLEYDIFATRANALEYWRQIVVPFGQVLGDRPAQGLPLPALSLPKIGWVVAVAGKVIVTTETRDKKLSTAFPLERSALAYLRAIVQSIHQRRRSCPTGP